MNYEETIMGIIMHGGNARSLAMEAIRLARHGDDKESKALLEQSDGELNKAHQIQTNLIQSEVRGEKIEVSLLMVHAQDHLMNAMTVYDLAKEIIELCKEK